MICGLRPAVSKKKNFMTPIAPSPKIGRLSDSYSDGRNACDSPGGGYARMIVSRILSPVYITVGGAQGRLMGDLNPPWLRHCSRASNVPKPSVFDSVGAPVGTCSDFGSYGLAGRWPKECLQIK